MTNYNQKISGYILYAAYCPLSYPVPTTDQRRQCPNTVWLSGKF